jgi:ATP-independent RNA helicase DbpA
MSTLKVITLDEADRMLEMGFIEDIERILDQAPTDRQTLMFSATFSESIKRLATRFQKNGEWIAPALDDEGAIAEGVADPKITQLFYAAPGDLIESKTELLIRLLSEIQPNSCVVFCNFKVHVADVQQQLLEVGISAAALHGDLEQPERDRVMAQFRNNSIRVLVATDVAARGIHVDDVGLVINYDVPKQSEIYVHRIGRTGRLQKEGVMEGVAVTLIMPNERPKIAWLEKECNVTIQEKSLESPGLAPVPMPAPMRTLFISGGRKDKVRPGDILGALTGEAGGFAGTDIGKIEIHDFFSYVAVKSSIAAQALKSLQAGRMKGRRFRVEYLKQ